MRGSIIESVFAGNIHLLDEIKATRHQTFKVTHNYLCITDKPGSRVRGSIIKGVFAGSIHIPDEQETYHVEKSNRFFENKPVFHSVIYKESHMNLDPFRWAIVIKAEIYLWYLPVVYSDAIYWCLLP